MDTVGRGSSAANSFEISVRLDVQQRHAVRRHAVAVGLVTFGCLWGLSHVLMRAGIQSMTLRYSIALIGAYLIYLGLLRLWAEWLLSSEKGDKEIDFDDLGTSCLPRAARDAENSTVFRSGRGGDFGSGGATGSFTAKDEGLSSWADGGSSISGSSRPGAVEAVDFEDEEASLVSVAVAVGMAVAMFVAMGFAVFSLFGVEVLMGVVVEIAFASAGSAVALKAQGEGWLRHAVGRTVKPMATLLVATLALALAVEHWMPLARTLPQALKLLLTRGG